MKFFKSPLGTLLRNLVVAYVAFMLCRIVFIWANWTVLQGTLSGDGVLLSMLKGSILFDTAGLMYLTVLYTLLTFLPLHFKEKPGYYSFLRILFIVLIGAGVAANIADTVYFPYTGCRSTLAIMTEFQDEGTGELAKIFYDNIVQNWPLFLFLVAVIVLLCFTVKAAQPVRYGKLWKYYTLTTVQLAVCLLLSVAGMRGGISKSIRPIAMTNAYQYAGTTAQAAAVLNTPFSAIRSIGHKTMTVPAYFKADELESRYQAIFQPDTTQVFKDRNVVIIILESFGAEYSGAMNQGREGIHDCTPFLDSLMQHSLCFEWGMANGRKSIDAMPSVLSGIPMLGDHLFLTGTMMSNPAGSIAAYLKEKGYHSAFFHGADNSSMGFQSFSRATGFDSYYGMTEFLSSPKYNGKDDFDGVWAIWDEEFLQFMADEMHDMQQPFVTGVFTASSHNPFNLPERYREVWPDNGNLPIYKTVRYSDNALRLFFERVSHEPWFNNTLFVLAADHTNLSEHVDYQSALGQFRIPIIFYAPGDSIAGTRHCLAQQSDILPTVMGYLGYDKPFVCFGQNLLSTPDSDVWTANFQNGIYMFYQGDLAIQFDGENLLGTFEYKKDTRLENNVKGRYPELEQSMTDALKAVIQSYMEHMAGKPLILE